MGKKQLQLCVWHTFNYDLSNFDHKAKKSKNLRVFLNFLTVLNKESKQSLLPRIMSYTKTFSQSLLRNCKLNFVVMFFFTQSL